MNYERESDFLRLHFGLVFNRVKAGVYVDLGCSHPTNTSLTAFCRDLGWRGVAIDGNPDYQKDWIDAGFGNHFYNAILSDEPRARFAIHDNAFTSRLSPTIHHDRSDLWGITRIVEQDTVPVNQILAERGIEKIDLLCCDLEGAEARVLKTLDWAKHQPAFVIVEFVTHGEGMDCEAVNYLFGIGYEAIQMFPSNMILKRK